MNSLVLKIFDRVRSEDERVRSRAVTDLGLILEMYQWNLSKEARRNRYEDLLTEDIIELDLDENELTEIVEFLKGEIEKDSDLSSSMLFAMGKAPSSVGIKPLLEVVQNKLESFDEDELYAALSALERQLPFEDDLDFEEKRRIFSEAKILTRISHKILSLLPILNSGLHSTHSRFSACLILLLEIDR